MSDLNDKHIHFSSTVAATIGLEEAIMLSTLHDAAQWLGQQNGCTLFEPQLEKQWPFWDAREIQRISKSLADKGVIELFSAPYTQCLRLQFRLLHTQHSSPVQASSQASTTTTSAKPANTTYTQQTAVSNAGANIIAANWQPDQDTLAQLAQHHIPINFTQHQVAPFVHYWRERKQASHAWGAKFVKHVLREWQIERGKGFQASDKNQTYPMHAQWRPSQDAVAILQNQGIEIHFIKQAIAEFILYWQQRGDASNTWDSQFINHIKHQWARYHHTLQNDNTPTAIHKAWQPSANAWEVLELAQIDRQFAQSEIPAFVLFWMDRNELHHSWDSKFIQHAKYQWAKRHQLNAGYANENNTATRSTSTAKDPDFIRRHQDDSWADGLL